MSGFERSAPVPGSQGPRRSQMLRFNNAPPPLTPWRAEVLEAQRQMGASKPSRPSQSMTRSPGRGAGARSRRSGEGALVDGELGGNRSYALAHTVRRQAGPSAMAAQSVVGAEKSVVLRQARERGEGWYAAVARASQSWDTVKARRRPPDDSALDSAAAKRRDTKDSKGVRDTKDAREANESAAQETDRPAVGAAGTGEAAGARFEQDEMERQQREEFESRAEERRLKAIEDKTRADEERRRSEEMQKQRQQKLKGAFAFSADDDEDAERDAHLVRKAAELKKTSIDPPRLELTSTSMGSASGSLALLTQDPSFSAKLRFEPGLSPAEAFMRLTERKRKGRHSEFGGPPRGCSPWRDGKRGISYPDPSRP